MSYFEDYIEGGLCCEQCGTFMGGDEPGYVRVCYGCAPKPEKPKRKKKGRKA
jgi:hypothetical protein